MNVSDEKIRNDRIFCWEQVTRTIPVFRVSRVFASQDDASRLLPLYALFSIIEQIYVGYSDDEIARSKLDWWRIETSQEKIRLSQHPVLRELVRTGAVNYLSVGSVDSLLNGAESKFDTRAPVDISDLLMICEQLQRPRLDLEISVCKAQPGVVKIPSGYLERSGLFQLFRESAKRKEQGAYWWVPLNLLAKYSVNRDELDSHSEPAKLSAMLAEIQTESRLRVQLSPKGFRNVPEITSLRHYFALNGLYAAKLKRLGKATLAKGESEFDRIRVSDLYTAWRSARRFDY
jgi:hypothetical protein